MAHTAVPCARWHSSVYDLSSAPCTKSRQRNPQGFLAGAFRSAGTPAGPLLQRSSNIFAQGKKPRTGKMCGAEACHCPCVEQSKPGRDFSTTGKPPRGSGVSGGSGDGPISRAHSPMGRSGMQYRTPGRTVAIELPSGHSRTGGCGWEDLSQ